MKTGDVTITNAEVNITGCDGMWAKMTSRMSTTAVKPWHYGLPQNLEVFKVEADFASDCRPSGRSLFPPLEIIFQRGGGVLVLVPSKD
jgi:hypothetical protein